LNLRVRDGQEELTGRQFWGGLLGPIAALLFWLAVLFFGWVMYRTGELVIPIEETITEYPNSPKRKPKRKK
jgi:hypothetical protein